MEKIKFLDLFAGIGGFSLGLERAGMECVGQVEIDSYCNKVLEKHWPDVKRMKDIHDVKGNEFGAVELICGGFPCQPFSCAGKQKGKEDDRYLWPEMLRVIQAVKPNWVIGENVGGFINMGLEECVSDLEGIGYEVQPMVIPACAVDAKHRRDRVWIVAHTRGGGFRKQNFCSQQQGRAKVISTSKTLSNTKLVNDDKPRFRTGKICGKQSGQAKILRPSEWLPEPPVGRVANGIPGRVVRLKALGNAVVPQVVEVLGAVIVQAEGQKISPKKGE